MYSRKAINQISSRSEIYGYYGTSLERRIRLTIDKISSIISNLAEVISGTIVTNSRLGVEIYQLNRESCPGTW